MDDEIEGLDEIHEEPEATSRTPSPTQSTPPTTPATESNPILDDPTIIAAIPVIQQLPAISLSGNNAQRTLWIGDVPASWTEETLTMVFTNHGHPPYKVKRVYMRDELKGYCFIEFTDFEEARQTLFDLNGAKVKDHKDVRFNLCFANDSYNPNAEFNLHVSNVPCDMSDAELYRIFDKYHSCRGAKMFRFVDGSSKGTGFVRFGDQTDQQMALVEMHRTRVGNVRIFLRLAGPKGERLDQQETRPYGTAPPKKERVRREERPSQYRNGTALPQPTQMYDAFGNTVMMPADKNVYWTDNPWAPLPDDADLDPVIGLDLLTTRYRPQISNKRLMIDGDQFLLDLDSSRWCPIVFKTNIKKEDFEQRLTANPWTPIP